VDALDRLLGLLALPARPLLQVSRPWWPIGQVLAGSDEDGKLRTREAEEAGLLEQWVREQAVPRSVAMEEGVNLHAEAVGRPSGQLDALLVRVWQPGLVRPGMPVTTGDHYVGLVSHVVERHGRDGAFEDVTVDLITGTGARIGAGVLVEGVWQPNSLFVVGGLLAPEDFGLASQREVLAVHHPSNYSLSAGRVLVHEAAIGGRDLAGLANGFQLGTLERAPEPDEHTRMDLLGVVPEVDFESGLYQVLIHTGLSTEQIGSQIESVGQRGHWIPAQPIPLADPAPWREGCKLARGTRAGVQVGAALASGVRLIGRVERAGPWHANVSTLGDRGFTVPAIALWLNAEAEHPTFVLGRLQGLGRDSKGNLLFHWAAALPRIGEEPARARIYTGSGEPGVPRGLLLGEADIPFGPGPHRLVIEPPDSSDVWQDVRLFQFEGVGP